MLLYTARLTEGGISSKTGPVFHSSVSIPFASTALLKAPDRFFYPSNDLSAEISMVRSSGFTRYPFIQHLMLPSCPHQHWPVIARIGMKYGRSRFYPWHEWLWWPLNRSSGKLLIIHKNSKKLPSGDTLKGIHRVPRPSPSQ